MVTMQISQQHPLDNYFWNLARREQTLQSLENIDQALLHSKPSE